MVHMYHDGSQIGGERIAGIRLAGRAQMSFSNMPRTELEVLTGPAKEETRSRFELDETSAP